MTEEQFGFDLGSNGGSDSEGADDGHDGPLFGPDEIRDDALGIIAEARRCTGDGPWDAAEVNYRRAMFPHLVSWIPDEDERDQLCFAFLREVQRIEMLLAA